VTPDDAIDDEMRQRISATADRLRGEAMAGTDLSWAFFDLGKFSLSIGDVGEALNAYAKAVQLSTASPMIETSIRSLDRLERQGAASDEIGLARRLLCVGLAARFDDAVMRADLAALANPGPLESPICVLAGGSSADIPRGLRDAVVESMAGRRGTLISGGTEQGVGAVAGDVGERNGTLHVIGYLPQDLPDGVVAGLVPERYTELRRSPSRDFGPFEPLSYWTDIVAAGITPRSVRVLGIGGGPISAFEYRLAAAIGSPVGLVGDTGREASAMLHDPLWGKTANVEEVPPTRQAIAAFLGDVGADEMDR
jgi:hypothetical protein